MNIISAARDLNASPRRVCLAVGFFDGVHLGHQQLIRQTIADARQREAQAVVVTFDRHPASIVAPQYAPALIYSLPQKLRVIESLGADAALVIPFDKTFSEQTGEMFIRQLARELGELQSLCVGSSFVFGHKRSGNVTLLKSLGEELKFTVHGLAAVALDGKIVSSTRIRETIQLGELDAVNQMLGRAYSLSGPVVRGDELGRKIGFPTANVDTDGLVLPPNGVYAVHASVDGTAHRAVLNIGLRPSVNIPTPKRRVEAHLLDFSGDLYGREIEIIFREQLRAEKQFPSLEALSEQIAVDISEARNKF